VLYVEEPDAGDSTSLEGKLGLVARPDGKKQVTYKGKLLYSFPRIGLDRSRVMASRMRSAAGSSLGTSYTLSARRLKERRRPRQWELTRVLVAGLGNAAATHGVAARMIWLVRTGGSRSLSKRRHVAGTQLFAT
jgi:hypothetical protein